jgi:hypothetical protein
MSDKKRKIQTHVNNMLRTGDDARDFSSGCIAIQAAIKDAIAQSNIPAKNVNVSWAEPVSLSPTPQVANFTVTANGRTVTLEITRRRVLDSYERVGDPLISCAPYMNWHINSQCDGAAATRARLLCLVRRLSTNLLSTSWKARSMNIPEVLLGEFSETSQIPLRWSSPWRQCNDLAGTPLNNERRNQNQ